MKLIVFRRNFGQTAALMAGFDHSGGEIVVAIDGDGQNDPTTRRHGLITMSGYR